MARLIILTSEPENEVPKRLKEEAEKLNLETELINPLNCYISLSTNDVYISHEGTKFMGADFCIPRLSEDSLEYKVAIMDHLESMGVKMMNDGPSMRNCSNKILTQILLTRENIATPKTVVVTNDEQLDYAVKAIGDKFPVIVKTLFGTHGVGVIRADSFPSLRSIAQQLLKSETDFMIQEFIEHKESGRIYVLGGDVMAAVMRTIPDGDFRSNAHQGAELKIHEPSDKEKEICIKAAKTVGTNFSAVDYIVDDNGEVIIIEVNGSPGFEAMQEKVEFNVAQKVVKWLIGDESEVDKKEEKPEEKEEKTEKPEEKEEQSTVSSRIIGSITEVKIKYFNDDKPIEARVDTGATHSSMHADDIEVDDNIVKFRFGEYIYKFPMLRNSKTKTSDNDAEFKERPTIVVNMEINGISINNVQLTLNNREHMNFNVLLGRSALAAAGVLIDPAAGNIDGIDNNPVIEPSEGEKEEE